ncbi:MAG: hypothetical protein HC927_06775 [Deltaproteobacteria bacterium]|nr:hypothetical protein [Deltaproteobacteria bacterium]
MGRGRSCSCRTRRSTRRTSPACIDAQTAWIRDNVRKNNIKYVFHLGDIVNVNSLPEWRQAREAMSLLDGVVPYVMTAGNHDYGPGGNAATRDTFLNQFFRYEEQAAWPTFGGAYQPGRLDNTYHLFSAGGVDWIVFSLEWGPRDGVIAWANGVAQQYPNRKAILVTHAYMNNNDLRYDITDTVNPPGLQPPLLQHARRRQRRPAALGQAGPGQQLRAYLQWSRAGRRHGLPYRCQRCGQPGGADAGQLPVPQPRWRRLPPPHRVPARWPDGQRPLLLPDLQQLPPGGRSELHLHARPGRQGRRCGWHPRLL